MLLFHIIICEILSEINTGAGVLAGGRRSRNPKQARIRLPIQDASRRTQRQQNYKGMNVSFDLKAQFRDIPFYQGVVKRHSFLSGRRSRSLRPLSPKSPAGKPNTGVSGMLQRLGLVQHFDLLPRLTCFCVWISVLSAYSVNTSYHNNIDNHDGTPDTQAVH